MILYHGTTLAHAHSIKQHGLVPHNDHRFHLGVKGFFGSYSLLEDFDANELIYLSREIGVAEAYARFRVEYEPAQRGSLITFNAGGYDEGEFTPVQFRKEAESCRCVPVPAIVTFNVPDALYEQLGRDPEYTRGVVCTCVIPPQFIVDVTELKADDEWVMRLNAAKHSRLKADFDTVIDALRELEELPDEDDV